ncbi:methylenetetrahydrofolate--tRNA-(uracil(54)-C(5))-methyltransferase (FADH(2)-oxidizing) TrmFO [Natranaerobius thermophilus]|uniref:Methylenetetrahydrofolate--tRNA-(uracil-5-)-methyltransferase TrmFO n=1 Tax=Natranaerobius thermophilus (strain ATCC BAA-1301 / DSM 18059 / JW/NM-WN-LF) TaxID=457570 RepID=TRMFO_NATTJ|nr:methylenetetrahydrofolate--tRNA-(uracil(54)-C(5))-methyltransferase (FADH(2)-oxidizing) TrmFO [Natranaerobius thermophilus]B2A334.1 RecName: Full=Methylenetetrahydrofolate--tRNA-(uracil-5-)-methyltransferase TrmFO; AltName: Full=Folate-dependent tRNA (uracil-5-)-methyltransferase; AltName: Full=Folate-dependent tRNA(M-5-U54)-methyltransferase [Natranaerobius thermophilus JW/NM-WN-LF]ACB84965.1 gid protein [Natranaerobius thermophilus JW/NM-WN-LF]
MRLTVIGGGLAGSEAAYQAAQQGVTVDLYEMRPVKTTAAHKTGELAELVCSNSLRAKSLENAAGLLKEELRKFDSLIMKVADQVQVPAGGALAVDREAFSQKVTEYIENHPNINLITEEVTEINESQPTVIATGPLTSTSLTERIQKLTGTDFLYFYDAAAPIVTYESINKNIAYWASRYGKGTPDYLNCPMTKEEYEDFYQELINAEKVPLKSFEKEVVFEGCMPVEQMANRGKDTLVFGPLKPVGLENPNTGEMPYAVVQLRKDNREGTLYNLVGFQTRLKWPEQRRVFRKIPGLEEAEFVRYGVMHRNTFINSPKVLTANYQLRERPGLFFAGQVTGVEGYVESTASGLVAGLNAARKLQGNETLTFPRETALGALASYIVEASPDNFQPMNINFGLLPSLEKKVPKKIKKQKQSERALKILEEFIERKL